MDGTRDELSARLIAASIPLQALMMAAAAIIALAAASHGQPASTFQVTPSKAPAVYNLPVEVCWNIGLQGPPGSANKVPVPGGCRNATLQP